MVNGTGGGTRLPNGSTTLAKDCRVHLLEKAARQIDAPSRDPALGHGSARV
jgi:hypothetical protein